MHGKQLPHALRVPTLLSWGHSRCSGLSEHAPRIVDAAEMRELIKGPGLSEAVDPEVRTGVKQFAHAALSLLLKLPPAGTARFIICTVPMHWPPLPRVVPMIQGDIRNVPDVPASSPGSDCQILLLAVKVKPRVNWHLAQKSDGSKQTPCSDVATRYRFGAPGGHCMERGDGV